MRPRITLPKRADLNNPPTSVDPLGTTHNVSTNTPDKKINRQVDQIDQVGQSETEAAAAQKWRRKKGKS